MGWGLPCWCVWDAAAICRHTHTHTHTYTSTPTPTHPHLCSRKRHRVRHEAAEALGAIAAPDCLELLQAHSTDACVELAETCQLALGRLKHLVDKQQHAAAAGAAAGSGQQQQQQHTAGAAAGAAAAASNEADESPYFSVDPTPALPASTPIEQLRAVLLDPQQPMFEVRWLLARACWLVPADVARPGWGGLLAA